jgi:hypothetical protein
MFAAKKRQAALDLLEVGQAAEAIAGFQALVTDKVTYANFENAYSLAIAYQTFVGDGLNARRWFNQAWQLAEPLLKSGKLAPDDQRIPWTIHNAAQYCLDWEEYQSWFVWMRQLAPQAPMIDGDGNQYEFVRGFRSRGWTWPEILMERAIAYTTPDAVAGMKRVMTAHSCAASIYQFLLASFPDLPADLVELCKPDYELQLWRLIALYRGTFARSDTTATSALISQSINVGRYGRLANVRSRTTPTIEEQILFHQQLVGLIDDGYHRTVAEVWSANADRLWFGNARRHCLYEVATLYASRLGLGEQALACYEDLWAVREHSGPLYAVVGDEAPGFAAENAMLLAPSADVFRTWRDRLVSVDPQAAILREVGRTYVERAEAGEPWYEVIAGLLPGFYHRLDADQDRARYGDAAALLRSLLLARRELRLPREVWRGFVKEYGLLTWRLCAQASRRDRPKRPIEWAPWVKAPPAYSPADELAWMAGQALAVVDEYARRYPDDTEMAELVVQPLRQIADGHGVG